MTEQPNRLEPGALADESTHGLTGNKLLERRLGCLMRLHNDIPSYVGDAPKAQHYQAMRDAITAAIQALRAQPDRPAGPLPLSRGAPMVEGLEDMLLRDNQRMRQAGCKLAEAAMHVIREYDGVHRLSLAVAAWAKAVAAEGDRPHKPSPGRSAGGRARAAKLSPERRSEIAINAARARWDAIP